MDILIVLSFCLCQLITMHINNKVDNEYRLKHNLNTLLKYIKNITSSHKNLTDLMLTDVKTNFGPRKTFFANKNDSLAVEKLDRFVGKYLTVSITATLSGIV